MNKLVTFILLALPFIGFAQADWENPKGAIKDEEVVIEKDKQITLPVISRRFEAITIDLPQRDTTAVVKAPRDIVLTIPKIPVKLRPKPMKGELLEQTYWGSFKVGYGSYISPLIQADVATKRSDEYALALHFRHYSSKNGPVDKANSGMSNTDAYVNGKLFLNAVTLGAHLGANLGKYHLYGYEGLASVPIAEDIQQTLTNYSVGVDLTDNDKNEDFTYALKGGIELFHAKDLLWKESDFYADLRTRYTIFDDMDIQINAGLHSSKQEKNLFPLTTNRLLYKINPIVTYKMEPFEFEIGAGLFGTKDSVNSFQHKIYFAPHLVARYTFEGGHIVSGGVTGDVQWQSARTQFNENPYLGGFTVVNSDVKPLDFFLKANGKIAPKLSYSAGYHAAIYKLIGQYLNMPGDPSTFYLYYDEGNNFKQTFSAALDFEASKNLSFQLNGSYFTYAFENYSNAWHMPDYDLRAKVRFTLEEKLTTELVFTYLGGLKALEPNFTAQTVTLNPIADLNLNVDYKVSNMISVFVKMQNILGNQYQYFYKYPTKGFQVLGGVRFTF